MLWVTQDDDVLTNNFEAKTIELNVSNGVYHPATECSFQSN